MQSPFTGRVALHQQHQRRFCSKVHLAHECLSPWETFERKVKNKKNCKSHLECICIMHTPFKMTKNTGRSPFTDKAINAGSWHPATNQQFLFGTICTISIGHHFTSAIPKWHEDTPVVASKQQCAVLCCALPGDLITSGEQ